MEDPARGTNLIELNLMNEEK